MEPLPLPAPAHRPALGDRALFGDLAARSYLNHAAISPVSTPVRAAALQALDDVARHGVGTVLRWIEQRERLRVRLGRLLGVAPETLGYVANTSTGVLTVAHGLPWRPEAQVLCFEGEFPTNVLPWVRAAEQHGLEVLRLPLDGFGDGSGSGLERVEAALRGGSVQLVAVSAVQFQTGLAMPLRALADLAHAHGAELFVDGIQAVGAAPLDLAALGVDYMSCGSHKWLMGLEGGAVLYVHPDRIGGLRKGWSSWLSVEESVDFLFGERDQLRYDRPVRGRTDFTELGAQNAVGYAALEASVALLEELGPTSIAAHLQAWHDAVEPGLVELGFTSRRASDPTARSGILSLLPPPGVELAALAGALGERGVAVSTPDGHLRLSPHWPNALAECQLVVDVFGETLGR